MIESLLTIGLRHRAPVIVFISIVTIYFLLGMSKLEIDTGVNSLIPANNPERMLYQNVMQEFGSDNKTIIYIKDSNLWTPETLLKLEQLHRDLQRIDKVTRVDSLYSLHTIIGDKGQIQSKAILNEPPSTLAEAVQARERALSNPLYLGNFFSGDAEVTAIIVSVTDMGEEKDFSQRMYNDLEQVMGHYRDDFQILTQVGPPRINAELRESLYGDLLTLGPISALILVVSILLFLRSTCAAVIPLITSGLTIIWTFGMLGWLGIPLNILSAMLPSLIIAIGSTEDTHMMAAYFRGIQDQNCVNRDDCIRYMGRHIGLPLILTVLTTSMGFGSNLFSNIGLIQHFALAATFAMLANGLITILCLPLILSIWGPKAVKLKDKDNPTVPERVMKLFRYSQDTYPMATLAITAVLCGFFIFQASKLYVTNDPLSYFPEDRPLIQDTKRIHEDLAGIKIFFITLETNKEKAFLEPGNIAKLEEIQEFMQRQDDAFDRTISMADHLKFVNREFRGQFAELSLPESRKLVAQYLMFFHRSDLDSYVSHDYSRANIIVRHNISDSYTLNQHIDELKDVVSHIVGPDMEVHIVGENLMVNHAAENLMVGQVKALGLLLILIFLIMSTMFTSLKGGAIALVPAVIPIALMFGIMGLLEIPLNPGTAMVAVIAIGIAIDGTIHLLARYNELCRKTSDYVSAVNISVDEEATPLIVSSVALALGFGILLFSNFTVVAQFGALAAATMLFSVIANLLITPIIMSRIRLVGLYQIIATNVDKDVLNASTLFNGMSDYQRRKAIVISEMNEFAEGDLIIEQDTTGRCMFLILSGTAKVVRRDNGEEKVFAQLEPGAVIGEVGYIRETKRTADVRATSPITALRFDYERMQKDLKFFPNIVAKLNFNISYILGERLADMVEHSKS